jgi:crossover junction endodeoxyribonuclease RusA
VNNQYVTVGRRRVLSPGAKSFRRGAAAVMRQAFDQGRIDEEWLSGVRGQPLACDLVFYFETPFKRDLDGGLKITLDALFDALQLDDRHIVSLTLEKRIAPLQPRVEVELGAIPDWQFDTWYDSLGLGQPQEQAPEKSSKPGERGEHHVVD